MAKEAVTTRARSTASAKSTPSWISRPPVFLEALGPGIVTGAADDDPSGIATYSQIGAQFGFATHHCLFE
jgi:Mn2+/Fe2+ NRAMP family transporter